MIWFSTVYVELKVFKVFLDQDNDNLLLIYLFIYYCQIY
jgi:hypothetical protein